MITVQRLKRMLSRYMALNKAEFLAHKIMKLIDKERAENLKDFARLYGDKRGNDRQS